MEDGDYTQRVAAVSGRLDKFDALLNSPLGLATSLLDLLRERHLPVAVAVCAGLVAVLEAIPDQ